MKQKVKQVLQMVFLISLGLILLMYVKKVDLQSKAPRQITPSKQMNKKDQAIPGLTLIPISGPELINLVDLEGQIKHSWKGIDVDRARLLPNCHLLALHGSKLNLHRQPWAGLIKRVSEYDWEGNLVWSYTAPDHLHHDVQRLANGNTMLLQNVTLPKNEKDKIKDRTRRGFEILADMIVEVNSEGEVVWEWKSWEHLDVNNCGAEQCLGSANLPLDNREQRDIADWTHFNTLSILPDNQWYEAGDQRFRPGNILTVARNFSEILIIDRWSGDIVWRYHGDYQGGMVRGHEASMITKGLEGAGNIIVLDNGFDEIREESYILEIEPPSQRLVWVYNDGKKFFTRARGSVQRLDRGHTLISEDRSGRVFEVNRQGKIVWQNENNGQLIIRAQRYPNNYCEKF